MDSNVWNCGGDQKSQTPTTNAAVNTYLSKSIIMFALILTPSFSFIFSFILVSPYLRVSRPMSANFEGISPLCLALVAKFQQ